MNLAQRIVLLLGACAFAVIALCPPWVNVKTGEPFGFAPVWNKPYTVDYSDVYDYSASTYGKRVYRESRIDLPPLLALEAAVLVVTTSLFVVLSTRKRDKAAGGQERGLTGSGLLRGKAVREVRGETDS